MERKIGEIFEYNGEWYQVVECDSCGECSLRATECGSGTKSDLADEVFGECSKVRRSDSRHAIFKKLEKVGEPCTHYCPSGRIIYFQGYKLFHKLYSHNTEYIMCDFNEGGIVSIEIKQNKEDMEEKYKAENTPLTRLVGKYVNNLIDYNVFEKAVKELYTDKEENKPLLKEFDLEAAKAGKPVCTRDGRKARIICFDANDSNNQPIIALITEENGFESLYSFTSKGKWVKEDSVHDLMMLPEKKEGWIVIHKEAIYDKETAEKIARETTSNVIRIQKIEWEE